MGVAEVVLHSIMCAVVVATTSTITMIYHDHAEAKTIYNIVMWVFYS
jgi:hypothetical protein